MSTFKYNQVYDYLKKEIINNQIKYGTRLPSIRHASEVYNVSKTTIQNAYFQLEADGYIISIPKSGFYVEYKKQKEVSMSNETKADEILFDFRGETADSNSFNFSLWTKYMKSILRDDQSLLTASSPKGEFELRQALSDYIRENRNVAASPEHIIIGAGTYTLINIICSLLKEKGTVSVPEKSFVQGAKIFEDYGFDVHYRYKDAEIIYVAPSHMTSWGSIMPNKRKFELVSHAAETGALIIEDDYESDFLYNIKPVPTLYALSGGGNVVYMGSFSKLLLPSIKISFMVLTEKLTKNFDENSFKYTQTASKTEQLALSRYIRDGQLKAQIKKTRRFYTSKTREFYNLLKSEFSNANIEISENQLQIIMHIQFKKDTKVFKEKKIAVNIVNLENNIITIILNTASIKSCNFNEAISALKSALEC